MPVEQFAGFVQDARRVEWFSGQLERQTGRVHGGRDGYHDDRGGLDAHLARSRET